MSKITLTPNASGTGTFTVASPNSNTNRTLTLPDEAGELLINGTTSNVGIGTSSPSNYSDSANDLVVAGSGQRGITIASTDSVQSNLFFADADSGSGEYAGYLAYNHGSDYLIFGANSAERMRIDSSGNVGIGTSSPSRQLSLSHASQSEIGLLSGSDTNGGLIYHNASEQVVLIANRESDGHIAFQTGGVNERLRIDSSGNLLVGKTSAAYNTDGFQIQSNGISGATTSSGRPFFANRKGSDGTIIDLYKDGSTVGSIGTYVGSGVSQLFIAGGDTGLKFNKSVDKIGPSDGSGGSRDNQMDWGDTNNRWDDIYATNGTIQTSDRNEKQDIEALSDAEQRVAVACKGLLRKFRWIDSVAEKGDDARIHFGIIAQDLQDAFAAEGLDAGRYAMFISSTWWETQTEVPAVEAVEAVDAVYEDVVIPAVEEVLDEEGNVVTEAQPERIEQRLVTEAVDAVEAKDAYTRTDTYDTLEEAPEGATERTRLGVRYPELLAFIIGAM